ncbi:endonuclease/exonuclease/phosphatase family protein [Streptomyces sp. NPDC048641]|uniref:endonuclease/exonuclease/phosphatase family protein n=1 Tax=Streptomyces sp. NPDC048641 TaxID=3154825 RepID=UPI0034319A93
MRNGLVARGTAVVAAVAVLLGTLLVLPGALFVLPGGKAGPAEGSRVVRVLQYNLCGAAAGCPWNAGGSGRGTSVARLVESAVRSEPDIVTVNEICLTQYAALKEQLARAGRRMDGTYASSQDNVPACGRTGRFGSAVLSRGDVPDGRQDYRPFTHTGGETYTNGGRTVLVHRGLLCAHTSVQGERLVACTAHTYSKAPEQLREIRDWTAALPRSVPVVLAGDLNLPPDAPALSLLTRRFTEADRADDEPTAGGRKIDYLFAGRRHVRSAGADAVKYPESDHALLEGTFRLTR